MISVELGDIDNLNELTTLQLEARIEYLKCDRLPIIKLQLDYETDISKVYELNSERMKIYKEIDWYDKTR